MLQDNESPEEGKPNQDQLSRVKKLARLILARDLLQFFHSLSEPEVQHRLGERPGSKHLLPYFERYAQVVFEAQTSEHLHSSATPDPDFETHLVDQLLRDVSLLWKETVNEAWERVGVLFYANDASLKAEWDEGDAFGLEDFRRFPRRRLQIFLDLKAQNRRIDELASALPASTQTLANAASSPAENFSEGPCPEFLRNVYRLLRQARGKLKIADFAKAHDTNPDVIYKLRHGEKRCRLEVLEKLADSAKCAVSDLYREDCDPTKNKVLQKPVKLIQSVK